VSNSLAVAMVTAALRRVLGEALVAVPAGGVPNARVTTLRPDMLAAADGETRGINVFLYQVVGNGAGAENSLPTRRSDGTLVARPERAVDLHYLLTFSGDEAALEPQRLLGVAATVLVAQPVLGRQRLREIIAGALADDPTTWLQFSDLPDQVDLVRFTPTPLSLDEVSKLWSTFFQSPYRLSVAYQASVVVLEADLAVQPALPVLTRGVDAAALDLPVVRRVVAGSAAGDPIVPGAPIRIEGERLRGPAVTRVRLDDTEIPVPADGVSGTALRVLLPAGTRAGLRSVQVLHPRLIGDPPVEHVGAESGVVPLLVRPAVAGPVTAPAGTSSLVVPVRPAVARRQRVVVSLNEHRPPDGRAGRAYSFAVPLPAMGAPATVDRVTVPIAGVQAGTYLVRIQVDGAQSLLGVGADGRFDQPRVVLP
jgi:uncharacterized protein DUF4255